MEIKRRSFWREQKGLDGIILDDAYDLYKRNRYIDYVNKNNIKYIFCQDNDLNNLTFFPDTEYVTISSDAENLDALYSLKKLKGIQLTAKKADQIHLDRFPDLVDLLVYDSPKNIENISRCKNLENLYCTHWGIEDLTALRALKQIKLLNLDFCYKLKTLQGLSALSNLKNFTVEYCLKLRDVSELGEIASHLQRLRIADCNKIEDLSVLAKLKALRILHLTNFETTVQNKIPSVSFINELKYLREFMTDYKIEDGNLKPLLRIEYVEILHYFRHYNVPQSRFEK